MNLNSNLYRGRIICSLSMLFFFVLLIRFSRLSRFASADDIENYTGAMRFEYVSDWHSLLFYRELIVLKKVFCWLGEVLNCESLYDCMHQFLMLSYISHAFLFAALAYLLAKMARVDFKYAWLIIPWLFAIGVLFPRCVHAFWGNLESYNLIVLSLIIPVVIWLKTPSRLIRCILLILLVTLCVHATEYRRNAWILMPVIAYSAAMCISVTFRTRILVTLLIMLVTSFGAMGVSKLIPHQKMNSTSVMVTSDIKIAANLLNKLEEEERWLEDNCALKYPKRTKYKLRADSENCPSESNSADVLSRVSLNNEQWGALKERYWHYWTEHTREMILARVLSVQHLYCSIYTSPFIKGAIADRYPHIKDEDFGLPRPPVWERNLPTSYHLVTLVVLSFTSVGYLCILFCKRWMFSAIDTGIITILIASVLYYLSYMVVTPAPYSRYFGVSMLTFWLLIPVMWTRFYVIVQSSIKSKVLCVERIS